MGIKARRIILWVDFLCTWPVGATNGGLRALWPSIVELLAVLLLNQTIGGLLLGGFAAVVAILIGFLPSGLGLNPFVSLLIGAIVLVAMPFLSRREGHCAKT